MVETGFNWVVSRRAVAILTDKRIKCGDWEIPLASITKSELIKIRGLISTGQLLHITTDKNEGYQFGMQLNPDWMNQNVLPLQLINKKIKISLYSWVIRILIIAYLGYWVINKL